MFTKDKLTTLLSFHFYKLLAIMLISIGFAIAYVHSKSYNFLPCEYECGETLIAQSEARNVRMFGLKFGLLEDWATSPSISAHPHHYTHNVNIGSLTFISMELLGIKDFSMKQTLIILIWALGLLYAYTCIAHFSNSKLCGIISVLFLISDFAFSHTYTTHALRTWQWLPIFGLPFHISRYILNRRKIDILGSFALLCVSFGVGYDFWITMILSSLFIILFSLRNAPHINRRKALRMLTIFGVLAMTPFCLRQLHIIFVMGYKYWIVDFYNSIGIKIPYFSKFIHIPEIADLDAWYNKHNVARPPATPINAEILINILNMAKNSIFYVIIPSAGIITFLTTVSTAIFALYSTICSPKITIKNDFININVPKLCGYICSMLLGYGFGFFVTPSVSILYLLYVPPLIIAPLVASKSLLTTLLCRLMFLSIKKKQYYSATAFSIFTIFIFADHIKVQIDSLHSVKRMDTSWLPLLESMPKASFAVPYIQQAAAAFTNNWAVAVRGPGYQYEYFDLMEKGQLPFTRTDLAFFGEKDSDKVDYTKPDYFLYYSTDQRINMFDPEPECREDYIISFLRKNIRNTETNNVIKDISFESGLYDGKKSVLISGKTTTPYMQGIEVRLGNTGAQKLIYNCISSNFQGLFNLPSTDTNKISYQIYVNKDGQKKLAYQSQFKITEQKNVLTPPAARQPLVTEILSRYKNSGLNITSYKKGNKEYEGYVLIDLRKIYEKHVTTKALPKS